jgi:hypothetical protein
MTFAVAVAIAIVSLLVAIAWGIARYRRRSRQIREEQRRHWEVHERARATEGGINLRNAKIIERLYRPEAVVERSGTARSKRPKARPLATEMARHAGSRPRSPRVFQAARQVRTPSP